LMLCLAGAWLNTEQFFRSYLLAYLYWISISLGSFGIVMLHHLTGGGWGFLIRRLLESGTRTLPLMALLFVPLLVGLPHLYLWAQPAAVAADEALRHKSLYLNVPFFTLRTAVYFAAWIGLASVLNRWSLRQDRTAEPHLTRRLQILSGPGLVVYGLTATFASIDWVMSLDPHWFSTIYGMIFIMGQGLTTLAFMITVALILGGRGPLAAAISPARIHDLGNLLLAFVMLWAYLAFSQFLIIWSGNLSEEIPWYLHRGQGGWEWVALFLIVFYFGIPFLLLLSRETKRRARVLVAVAAALVLIRLVDLFWLVAPTFHPAGVRIHWMDLVAPVALGGIWTATFIWYLKGISLVPLHDPRFREGLGHD
ncbi:MAG: hypothetical protein ACREJP_05415, partial [Candidatus Methylomirabilales bacterium]